ncbi:MAG: energy-coupling factor ABC transporter ATP-binding protein [Synergistaceae bacterium]|jgi:cobalt/nickel transport system ATP-binding protein|nr:energy-coupling factor ABC transporter ATP-binding protein [Synergistaceae bacterium]
MDGQILELRVTNLAVRYDASEEHWALEDVSFVLREGERVALLGANGAGKSTLLLALVGVLETSSGEIALDGRVVRKETLRELRGKVGMVFQNPDDQLFMPTVHEDVAFGPRNYGVSEEQLEKRIEEVLYWLGILHLKNRLTHRLSGGEKRLAALAGILIMEPSILLMDEPFSFLDPQSRQRLKEILALLSQTMLIATHDLEMAKKFCHRAILLRAGRLMADVPIEDVLTDSALLERCGFQFGRKPSPSVKLR